MWISSVLSFLAFCHFAMCIKGHFKSLYRRQAVSWELYGLQSCAWLLLLLSLYPCVHLWEAEIGVTIWLGLITLSAAAVTLLINFFPAVFRGVWRGCPGGLLARLTPPAEPSRIRR